MHPNYLGKIAVETAGVPASITTDPSVRACQILFVTIPDLTGNIYVGGDGMRQDTLAGVMMKFNAPAATGTPDHFCVVSQDGTNALRLSDYFVDASVSGEGLLVTYFQR